jgi:hypothetical protein
LEPKQANREQAKTGKNNTHKRSYPKVNERPESPDFQNLTLASSPHNNPPNFLFDGGKAQKTFWLSANLLASSAISQTGRAFAPPKCESLP